MSFISHRGAALVLAFALGLSGRAAAQGTGNFLQQILPGFGGSDSSQTAPPPLPTHGVQDLTCEQGIVEPFELTENVSVVFEEAVGGATRALPGMLSRFLGTGGPDLDAVKGEALRSARAAARRANWLPMPLERELGARAHADLANVIDRGSFDNNDKEAYRTIDGVMDRMLQLVPKTHPYQFKIFLLHDETENAMALPGGLIYVTRGALPSKPSRSKDPKVMAQDRKDRDGKLRALQFMIAHEIAHVLKRHQTREVQGRVVDTLDTVEKVTQLFDGSGQVNAAMVLGAAKYLEKLHASYSPDQEKQADACAIRLMASSDKAAAQSTFMAFIESLHRTGSGPTPGHLSTGLMAQGDGSTHPGAQDRLAHGLEVLRRVGAR